MMLKLSKNELGFVDPLSLFAVLFLVVSIATATYYTTNTKLKNLIGSNAKTCEDLGSPSARQACRLGLTGTSMATTTSKTATIPPTSIQTGTTYCAACGGFYINSDTQTCNQAAQIKCGFVASTINCTSANEGQVVVYSSGANDYRKCVGGVWTNCNGVACTITDLSPNSVPTYLQNDYNLAIDAKAVADKAAADKLAAEKAAADALAAKQLADEQKLISAQNGNGNLSCSLLTACNSGFSRTQLSGTSLCNCVKDVVKTTAVQNVSLNVEQPLIQNTTVTTEIPRVVKDDIAFPAPAPVVTSTKPNIFDKFRDAFGKGSIFEGQSLNLGGGTSTGMAVNLPPQRILFSDNPQDRIDYYKGSAAAAGAGAAVAAGTIAAPFIPQAITTVNTILNLPTVAQATVIGGVSQISAIGTAGYLGIAALDCAIGFSGDLCAKGQNLAFNGVSTSPMGDFVNSVNSGAQSIVNIVTQPKKVLDTLAFLSSIRPKQITNTVDEPPIAINNITVKPNEQIIEDGVPVRWVKNPFTGAMEPVTVTNTASNTVPSVSTVSNNQVVTQSQSNILMRALLTNYINPVKSAASILAPATVLNVAINANVAKPPPPTTVQKIINFIKTGEIGDPLPAGIEVNTNQSTTVGVQLKDTDKPTLIQKTVDSVKSTVAKVTGSLGGATNTTPSTITNSSRNIRKPVTLAPSTTITQPTDIRASITSGIQDILDNLPIPIKLPKNPTNVKILAEDSNLRHYGIHIRGFYFGKSKQLVVDKTLAHGLIIKKYNLLALNEEPVAQIVDWSAEYILIDINSEFTIEVSGPEIAQAMLDYNAKPSLNIKLNGNYGSFGEGTYQDTLVNIAKGLKPSQFKSDDSNTTNFGAPPPPTPPSIPNSTISEVVNSPLYIKPSEAQDALNFFETNYKPGDPRFNKFTSGVKTIGYQFETNGKTYVVKVIVKNLDSYKNLTITGQELGYSKGVTVAPTTFVTGSDGETYAVQRFIAGERSISVNNPNYKPAIDSLKSKGVGISDPAGNIIYSDTYGPTIIDTEGLFDLNTAKLRVANQPELAPIYKNWFSLEEAQEYAKIVSTPISHSNSNQQTIVGLNLNSGSIPNGIRAINITLLQKVSDAMRAIKYYPAMTQLKPIALDTVGINSIKSAEELVDYKIGQCLTKSLM